MFLINGQFGWRFPQQLSNLMYSFSFSRQDKILIESLLSLSWEYGNVPTWFNLICQCCHVSVWKQRILFTLPSWSFPRGGCHRRCCREVKRDTVFSRRGQGWVDTREVFQLQVMSHNNKKYFLHWYEVIPSGIEAVEVLNPPLVLENPLSSFPLEKSRIPLTFPT